MQAPTIEPIRSEAAPVNDITPRLINPITGYALAIVVSGAVWAMLLAAIF